MTSAYREQIADVLRAVRVVSPTSYSWFGRRAPALDRAVRAQLAAPAAREYLVLRLERKLYVAFYLRGRASPQVPDDAFGPGADPAFVAALSRANSSRGGWASGWRVADVTADGALAAERDGLCVRVDPEDYRLGEDGPAPREAGVALRAATQLRPPVRGASVALRVPKELREASPGFYCARGDADDGDDPAAIEVRVYFHITREGAVPWLETATRLLNAGGHAFRAKLLDHPGSYSRCDAAVLYLARGSFAGAREPVRGIVAACAPHLRAQTPGLTKPLARGVGVGEHAPALGASFGLARCRLLAEGIADAYELGLSRLPDRVEAVERRFARHGIDLDAPYLASPEARDDYVL